MKSLKISDLSVSYGGNRNILNGIDMTIGENEIFALVGESGSGKSTLLKSILRILPEGGKIVSGKIIFNGRNIASLSPKNMQSLRGRWISMIFQEPGGTLNPVRKIGSQFIEAIKFHFPVSRDEAFHKAIGIMEKLRLNNPSSIMESYPFELSGGMKQRVAIAMSMALEPELLLADEPTSALDATVQVQVVNEMMRLRDQFGTNIFIVTHNISLAAYMADQVGVLYNGELVELGDKESILMSPAHPYTKSLIAAVPDIEGDYAVEKFYVVPNDFEVREKGCVFAERCSNREKICLYERPKLSHIASQHLLACHFA